MKHFILLIDGPKGSGKSTLLELLRPHLTNTEYLSLDHERSLIPRTDSRNNDNIRAFEVLSQKLRDALAHEKNVVIDSGISPERLGVIENMSVEYKTIFHKFSLIAPYEVLRQRVQARDLARGNTFDLDRFDYTFHAQQSKSFDGFHMIDTHQLSREEALQSVSSQILG